MNLAENAGKIIEEKKVRARKEDIVKKSKKQPFFYAREERLIFFLFQQLIDCTHVQKRLILTLTNLITIFLVWLFIYYANLMMCFLKRFQVVCH